MNQSAKHDFITVVSGLPRSGTSMMMKMLEAGGLEVLTDRIRTADDDNPKGYYEFERVKQLKTDSAWLPEARGKVVKIISLLLMELPEGYEYRVVFMRREFDEILASQRQMLVRRGKAADADNDERMAQIYTKHLRQVEAWFGKRPDIQVANVDYKDVVDNPCKAAERVNSFLGNTFDVAAMTAVVDSNLYRQRA